MIILGLTGSIGMGKTTTARMFRQLGVPVHDADRAVHQMMDPGGAAHDKIIKIFPNVQNGNKINRRALGDEVFSNEAALNSLEMILHPLVKQHKVKFLGQAARQRRPLVILDVPLLFETGGQAFCDGVITVSAPFFVQRTRVMARPQMTEQKFRAILNRQLPDHEKRRRSDFVILTGIGRHESLRSVRKVIEISRYWTARRWPPVTMGLEQMNICRNAKNTGWERKLNA